MKKNILPAILLLLSLAIVIGSFTFLSPCIHEDGSAGICQNAGRMLGALGCVTGITAFLAFFIKKSRFGLYVAMLPVCALGILTPGKLMSLCLMRTMRCQAVMRPGMIILFSIMLLTAAIGAAMSAGR